MDRKIVSLKYLKLALLLVTLLGCQRSKNKIQSKTDEIKDIILHKAQKSATIIVEELREPSIKKYPLFKKFPTLKEHRYKIKNTQGVKCEYLPCFYRYYFKYQANKEAILDFISHRESHFNEIKPDSICHKITYRSFRRNLKNRTHKELKEARFFFTFHQFDMEDLEFFECIRTPEKHSIIFNNKTKTVYHIIENFRE